MDSHKYTPIDTFKLETQLLKAIEDDSKYKREDAAKFRAVEQSKNYEEFRDMVKAAHLKPLEKHDSLCHSKISLVSWNKTVKRGCWRDKNLDAAKNHFEPHENVLNTPVLRRNFEQHWISLNDLERRITLLQGVIEINSFFERKDLSADMIESLINTLLEYLDPKSKLLPSKEKVDFVMKVMTSISSTLRFSLNLQLLSDKGWDKIRYILNLITELLEEKPDLENIKEALRDLKNKYSCW